MNSRPSAEAAAQFSPARKGGENKGARSATDCAASPAQRLLRTARLARSLRKHSYQLSAPLKNRIGAPRANAKIDYELSLQNRLRMPERPQKYQSGKEV